MKQTKQVKQMIFFFLTPAVLFFLLVFLYPVVRTIAMSFFYVEGVSDSTSSWQFIGLENYITLMKTAIFKESIKNMLKIWLWGGLITMSISMLFAVILTIVVYLGAMAATGLGPLEMLNAWGSGSGFWSLLSFAMQMALVLVFGSAMAAAKPCKKALGAIADIPELRRVVEASFPTETFLPETDGSAWDAAYAEYVRRFS